MDFPQTEDAIAALVGQTFLLKPEATTEYTRVVGYATMARIRVIGYATVASTGTQVKLDVQVYSIKHRCFIGHRKMNLSTFVKSYDVDTTPKTKIVKNLMTGKDVEIDIDAPLCIDPSSETYHSM